MGNYVSGCRSANEANGTGGTGRGKVVLWDGTVKEFDGIDHVTVAELMLEHPQQVVVEFSSAVSEKRPTPLPADKKLEKGKVYLLVPVKRGRPATLSSEEARRILLSANTVLRSRSLLSSAKFLPFFAKICPAGVPDLGVIQKLPSKKEEEGGDRREEMVGILEESLEGRPEYLSRQISGKGWKPSLDTIKEKQMKIKVSHWLY